MDKHKESAEGNKTSCLVIGLGNAGCFSLKLLHELGNYPEIEIVGLDTDRAVVSDLTSSGIKAELLGENEVNGHGTGGDWQAGLRILSGSKAKIDKYLQNRKLLIVVAGLGGGTGAAAEKLLASASRISLPAVLVAVMPFAFESPERKKIAENALNQVDIYCQVIVLVPNDQIHGSGVGVKESYNAAGDYVARAIIGITTPFASENLLNSSSGILNYLGRDGGPRCFLAQATRSEEETDEDLCKKLASDPSMADGKRLETVDKAVALLRVKGDCSESEIDSVFHRISRMLPSEDLENAICIDHVMKEKMRLTLLLHNDKINQSYSIVEEDTHKGKRRAHSAGAGQIPIPFPDSDIGIFQEDPPNERDGQNLDIPTFTRLGKRVYKGYGDSGVAKKNPTK